jgi:hypothetical protein
LLWLYHKMFYWIFMPPFLQKDKRSFILWTSMVFIAVDCLTEALEWTRIASIQVFHRNWQHEWRGRTCYVRSIMHTVWYTLACDGYVISILKNQGSRMDSKVDIVGKIHYYIWLWILLMNKRVIKSLFNNRLNVICLFT